MFMKKGMKLTKVGLRPFPMRPERLRAYLHTTTVMPSMTATIPPLTRGLLSLEGQHGDFRDDLAAQGYAVVKQAIPHNRAIRYQQKAFDWLKSFSPDLDLNDPDTWKTENLPVQSKINTFDHYGVVHEKFMWDARMEPEVINCFAKIWGTYKLLVSFDSLNISLPNRKDKPARTPWPHIDQSPLKRGVHCIQGIINLSHAGPDDGSLMLIPLSNNLQDEFFDTQTDPTSWETKDWRRFNDKEMEWWAKKGLHPIKVHAEPGDLILWDSRTVHWGAEPTEDSQIIRTVIYVCYSPARLATPETLEAKRHVFSHYGATTHWAHDNIFPRSLLARLPDGTVDPRNRSEPLEKPELSDKLLKLAGVKPY